MPIYYGKTRDGSDMKEVEGMHVSSCGNFWSSVPFTKESEKQMRKLANDKKWKKLIANKFGQK